MPTYTDDPDRAWPEPSDEELGIYAVSLPRTPPFPGDGAGEALLGAINRRLSRAEPEAGDDAYAAGVAARWRAGGIPWSWRVYAETIAARLAPPATLIQLRMFDAEGAAP